MLKKLSYLFMVLAVILTVSHNITAHDHHVVREVEHDEHDDDGDDDHSAHSFFSYGHIEDSFTNSRHDVSIHHDAPLLQFVSVLAPSIAAPEQHVIATRSFTDPPPIAGSRFSFRPLRAPPVC